MNCPLYKERVMGLEEVNQQRKQGKRQEESEREKRKGIKK